MEINRENILEVLGTIIEPDLKKDIIVIELEKVEIWSNGASEQLLFFRLLSVRVHYILEWGI